MAGHHSIFVGEHERGERGMPASLKVFRHLSAIWTAWTSLWVGSITSWQQLRRANLFAGSTMGPTPTAMPEGYFPSATAAACAVRGPSMDYRKMVILRAREGEGPPVFFFPQGSRFVFLKKLPPGKKGPVHDLLLGVDHVRSVNSISTKHL